MHYFIDGYNLLFRITRAGDELQQQRQKIIDELAAKINFIGLDATLVFDAQHYPGDSVRKHMHRMEIVFTAEGQTADEYILQRLKEAAHPARETVATSDKKLAWLSRRRLAHTQSIEEFVVWLNKRYRNKLRAASSRKTRQLTPLIKAKSPSVKHAPDSGASPSAPTANATPEECFDMYLELFESALGPEFFESAPEAEETAPLFAMPALGAKRKKKAQKRENPMVTDTTRWLKAFERPLEGEE